MCSKSALSRWRKARKPKSLTTKDTKLHEGTPTSRFLCEPSGPLWFLLLLHHHIYFAMLVDDLNSDGASIALQE